MSASRPASRKTPDPTAASVLELLPPACLVEGKGRVVTMNRGLQELLSGNKDAVRDVEALLAGLDLSEFEHQRIGAEIARWLEAATGTASVWRTRSESGSGLSVEARPAPDPQHPFLLLVSPDPATADVVAPGLGESFRRLVEMTPASVVVTDVSGRIEFVNPAFERQTGYSAEEAMGQNPRLLKSGSMPREVYEDLWSTVISGRTWTGRLCNRRKDGTLFWERATIAPQKDENGRLLRFLAVKQDISDLAFTEVQRDWMATLLDHSPEVCAIRDLEGRIVAVNQAFLNLCGRSREDVLGRDDSEVFGLDRDGEGIRGFFTLLEEVKHLARWESKSIDLVVRFDPKDPRTFRVCAFPVYNHAGHLVATGTVVSDITERNKREQELTAALAEVERASLARSGFLASVSHELRTPLNAIVGLSSVMLETTGLAMEDAINLEWILRSGEQLQKQIDGLLDFTHLSTASGQGAKRKFRIVETLAECLENHAEEVLSKGIELQCHYDPDLPLTAQGDTRNLELVVNNLLSNAVKFTRHGFIRFEAACDRVGDGTWLQVSVADSGPGMAASIRDRIFEPFTQGDASYSREHQGVGLGLAIARNATDVMGGELLLTESTPRGSRFLLRIPLEAPSEKKTFATDASLPIAGRNFRLVSRRRQYVSLLEGWINANGGTVTAVEAESLKSLQRAENDGAVLFLDWVLAAELPARELLSLMGSNLSLCWLGSERPTGADPEVPRHYHIRHLVSPAQLEKAFQHLCPGGVAPPALPPKQANRARPGRERARLAEEIPLRVLIVDDLETNRRVASRLLAHLGYDAATAVNGSDALEHLAAGAYDLVFLDLQMPVMDGFEAMAQIRQRYAQTPAPPRVVALTANVEEGIQERCATAGMDSYLSKPITPKQIEGVIRQLFSEADKDEKGRSTASRPAAPPALEPTVKALAEHPLVDDGQVREIAAAMPGGDGVAMLLELRETFLSEAAEALDQIGRAVREENQTALREIIHGLKGGAATLGWVRFREGCQGHLDALREGRFKAWKTLSGDLRTWLSESQAAFDDFIIKF